MITHESIEKNLGLLIVLTILIVSVGGMVQIFPLFFEGKLSQPIDTLKPLTAVQLEGRDIYIREGCNVCHTQMVRPLRAETERYGHYSVAGEYVYDRPFLWGSKRTGPDLQRVGGRYSDAWHVAHLMNPRDVVPESNMPAYPWLDRPLKDSAIQDKMRTLNIVGHGYTEQEIAEAPAALEGKTELEAVIAYLQVLGTHAPRN